MDGVQKKKDVFDGIDLMSDEAVRIKAELDTQAIMDFQFKSGEARGEARGETRGIKIGETRGEARGIEIGEARERERTRAIIDRMAAEIAELRKNAARQ